LRPSAVVSVVLIVSCSVFGGIIGITTAGARIFGLAGVGAGIVLSLVVLGLLRICLRVDFKTTVGGTIGAVTGLTVATILYAGVARFIEYSYTNAAVYALIVVVLTVVGMELGTANARELSRKLDRAHQESARSTGILDTSVIIDGRIAGVCETGFLDGNLVIPGFILRELQNIADSGDSTRRARGRRGLDVLNRIRKQSQVNIIIDDTDYPGVEEVDQKLIHLAKQTGDRIFTNDFNLNKVAEVHSIQVLNMNQLANALRPIVLPGETMRVQIIREGKEPGQGVAYLDDGTMVVVDQGKRHQGKTIEVAVTSVLQTPAGRMIFASARE
jgi:uncharacterized protein YacL